MMMFMDVGLIHVDPMQSLSINSFPTFMQALWVLV